MRAASSLAGSGLAGGIGAAGTLVGAGLGGMRELRSDAGGAAGGVGVAGRRRWRSARMPPRVPRARSRRASAGLRGGMACGAAGFFGGALARVFF